MTRAHSKPSSKGSDWSDAKNERRSKLIDRKIRGAITAEEVAELAGLQEEMLRYRNLVAPLPLEDARQLYAELKEKAQRAAQDQEK